MLLNKISENSTKGLYKLLQKEYNILKVRTLTKSKCL
nr:MAG TPA: hypothetical protein [Caudoviricetes sp.]